MFKDRLQAGNLLAQKIKKKFTHLSKQFMVILALPRGGVVVAHPIAQLFKAPLDIVVVRKIGAPENPECAIGAVSESGQVIIDSFEKDKIGLSQNYLKLKTQEETKEIKRRVKEYRGKRRREPLRGKTVILVDDGIATGYSMRAAIKEIQTQNPERIIVAVPVAPPETVSELKKEVDEVICLRTPSPFFAVGNFYTNFEQVTDEEVKAMLTGWGNQRNEQSQTLRKGKS